MVTEHEGLAKSNGWQRMPTPDLWINHLLTDCQMLGSGVSESLCPVTRSGWYLSLFLVQHYWLGTISIQNDHCSCFSVSDHKQVQCYISISCIMQHNYVVVISNRQECKIGLKNLGCLKKSKTANVKHSGFFGFFLFVAQLLWRRMVYKIFVPASYDLCSSPLQTYTTLKTWKCKT